MTEEKHKTEYKYLNITFTEGGQWIGLRVPMLWYKFFRHNIENFTIEELAECPLGKSPYRIKVLIPSYGVMYVHAVRFEDGRIFDATLRYKHGNLWWGDFADDA